MIVAFLLILAYASNATSSRKTDTGQREKRQEDRAGLDFKRPFHSRNLYQGNKQPEYHQANHQGYEHEGDTSAHRVVSLLANNDASYNVPSLGGYKKRKTAAARDVAMLVERRSQPGMWGKRSFSPQQRQQDRVRQLAYNLKRIMASPNGSNYRTNAALMEILKESLRKPTV